MRRLGTACAIAVTVAACVPQPGSIAAIPTPSGGTAATDTPEAQNARLERAYVPTRRTDEFTKDQYADLTIQRTSFDRSVVCTNGARSPSIYTAVRKFVDAEGKQSTLLNIGYYATEWLFADGTLLLLLNGQTLTFQPVAEPSTDVARGGVVSETMWYDVPADTLRHLANATDLKARISGRNGRCDFPIGPDARKLLSMFLDREVKARETPPPR